VRDPVETGFSLFMLSSVEVTQGDLSSARVLAEEGENINRSIGNRRNLGWSLMILGAVESAEGNLAKARSLFKESLTYFSELGEPWASMFLLAAFATLDGAALQPERALYLGGAVATLRDKIGGVLPHHFQTMFDSTLESARSALGAEAESAWERGRAMTMEQAIEYALEEQNDG
jgi:hypothetical protein